MAAALVLCSYVAAEGGGVETPVSQGSHRQHLAAPADPRQAPRYSRRHRWRDEVQPPVRVPVLQTPSLARTESAATGGLAAQGQLRVMTMHTTHVDQGHNTLVKARTTNVQPKHAHIHTRIHTRAHAYRQQRTVQLGGITTDELEAVLRVCLQSSPATSGAGTGCRHPGCTIIRDISTITAGICSYRCHGISLQS